MRSRCARRPARESHEAAPPGRLRPHSPPGPPAETRNRSPAIARAAPWRRARQPGLERRFAWTVHPAYNIDSFLSAWAAQAPIDQVVPATSPATPSRFGCSNAEAPAHDEVGDPASQSERHASSIPKGTIEQQKMRSLEVPAYGRESES